MRVVTLEAGSYVAHLAPAAGGRLAGLEWHGAGLRVPLLVPWDGASFSEHAWPKAGAFPMLPFCNRLPPAGFGFGGRWVCPEAGPAGFALHGSAHRRPWNVVQAAQDRAVLHQSHEGGAQGWPWPWSATMEFALAAGGLTVTIALRNDGTDPMPLAIGWHPYHPCARQGAAADLAFAAQSRHALDRDGQALAAPDQAGLRIEGGETAAFAGWDGRVHLGAPGGTLQVACEGARHLVVHRPAHADYLCVEPVTSLPGQLVRALPLQPGATRMLAWSCSYLAG